jgi:hypothetical protein
MKFFLIVFCFCSFARCLNSEHRDLARPVQNNSRDTLPENESHRFKDTFGVAYIDTLPLGVKFSVNPISMDSIIATVTFTNFSYKNIWIYLPVIKDTFMSRDGFTIIDKENANLPFAGVEEKSRFNSRNPDSSNFLIIPNIRSDNLLALKKDDSIKVNCNLAKAYDFNYLKKRGEQYFRIEYSYSFPYIEDGKHVYVDNYDLHVVQPVYFQVSTIKDISMAWQEKVKLPR